MKPPTRQWCIEIIQKTQIQIQMPRAHFKLWISWFFHVIDKIIYPTWYPHDIPIPNDDKSNLGYRWM